MNKTQTPDEVLREVYDSIKEIADKLPISDDWMAGYRGAFQDVLRHLIALRAGIS